MNTTAVDLSKLSREQLKSLLTILKGERFALSYSKLEGSKEQLIQLSNNIDKVRSEINKRKILGN